MLGRLTALAAATALTLTACTSEDGEDGGETSAADFTPVAFTTPWGEGTLEAPPERIAAEDMEDVAGNWQQTLSSLGEALGEEERADQVIEQTEDAAVTIREQHPEFAGKTVSLIQYFGMDEMRLLNPSGTDAATLFGDIGFEDDPGTAELKGVQLSAERVDDLAADAVVVLDNSDGQAGDLEDNAVFRSIPAVQDGQVLMITNNAFKQGNEASFEANGEHYEGNLAWAVAYPGPLSSRWALDTLAPLLADTVD